MSIWCIIALGKALLEIDGFAFWVGVLHSPDKLRIESSIASLGISNSLLTTRSMSTSYLDADPLDSIFGVLVELFFGVESPF